EARRGEARRAAARRRESIQAQAAGAQAMKRFVLALCVAAALPAHAYHAATHAGLTERAALASSLHQKLMQRFARALGLYEPLALDGNERDPSRSELVRRVGQLDSEG